MHKDDKSHKSNKFVAPLEYVKSLHVETQTGRPQQILQHLRCFFLNALLRFPICCSLGEVVEANVTEHVKKLNHTKDVSPSKALHQLTNVSR